MVETMMAIALLGVIVVTVLGAFSATALATSRHREETDLDRLLRSDVEYIKSQAYQNKPAAYANLVAAGYTFAAQVTYYRSADGSFSAANNESGLQQITVAVSVTGGALSERVIFLKVRP